MDNSKCLYEWFLKTNSRDVIWITKNVNVYQSLKSKNCPVALAYSFKGIRVLNEAKVGCYTNTLLDISLTKYLIPKDLKLIFLSHGQSVKNSRLTVNSGINESFKSNFMHKNEQIVAATTTSKFIARTEHKSEGICLDKYKTTGLARNDWLFNTSSSTKKRWSSFVLNLDYNKVVLYAPTWRMHGEKTVFFPFDDFNLSEITAFLENKKILLLIRPHIKDLSDDRKYRKDIEYIASSSRYIMLAANNEFEDVNIILPFVDILITDYSSIYHDYLLLDKPIIFIPYDYEQFNRLNGFKYDYFNNLPGPSIKSCKDLVFNLKKITDGIDEYVDSRKKLANKIHYYKDDSSCLRIEKLINSLEK
ncbi:CDP-glycerol glycerophosphotransferase (TagB/SpsB family) [Methanosalsum natronophilum]|nr:CDP-glycerol glycerophosphotransferase (TagB/SpsB family) [Methanosalsum natronophilum]